MGNRDTSCRALQATERNVVSTFCEMEPHGIKGGGGRGGCDQMDQMQAFRMSFWLKVKNRQWGARRPLMV